MFKKFYLVFPLLVLTSNFIMAEEKIKVVDLNLNLSKTGIYALMGGGIILLLAIIYWILQWRLLNSE
ncbi:hypothetical protein HOD53_01595 [Candidatus Woesearchaeota archaeon]|jgi:hypothetical protein|nr:hypothetical protein [Candidatus Woesearchaeota archaeon]